MKRLFFLYLVICHSALCFAQTPTHGPKIEFDVKQHDFGTFYYGDLNFYTFIITNTGNEDLTITSVKSTCDRMSIDYTKKTSSLEKQAFYK